MTSERVTNRIREMLDDSDEYYDSDEYLDMGGVQLGGAKDGPGGVPEAPPWPTPRRRWWKRGPVPTPKQETFPERTPRVRRRRRKKPVEKPPLWELPRRIPRGPPKRMKKPGEKPPVLIPLKLDLDLTRLAKTAKILMDQAKALKLKEDLANKKLRDQAILFRDQDPIEGFQRKMPRTRAKLKLVVKPKAKPNFSNYRRPAKYKPSTRKPTKNPVGRPRKVHMKNPGEPLYGLLARRFPLHKPPNIGLRSSMASALMHSGCGMSRKQAWNVIKQFYELLEHETKGNALQRKQVAYQKLRKKLISAGMDIE